MLSPTQEYQNLLKRGLEKIKNNRLKEGIANFQHASFLNPENPAPYYALGSIYFLKKDYQKAINYFKKASEKNPKMTKALSSLAETYDKLEDYENTAHYYQKAIKTDLKNAHLHYELANTYYRLGDYRSAIKYFQSAIRLNPKENIFYHNLGTVYNLIQDFPKAVLYLEKSIALNPDYFSSYFSLGNVYNLMNNHTKALQYYRKARKVDPKRQSILGPLIYELNYVCDWKEAGRLEPKLDQYIKSAAEVEGLISETPFSNIVREDDPKQNLTVAKIWSKWIEEKTAAFRKNLHFTFGRPTSSRIKIGYVSNNFKYSTTAQNITGVFEHHDKQKFEIFAYSIGPDDGSKYRRRIVRAVDHFIDITNLKHEETAKRIYQDKIDILVDLKGYTGGSRIFIFALRPAPIQVSLLGFIGSTGSSFMDYFVADRTVVPLENKKFFSEKVVYMPDTYWPTDDKLLVARTSYQKSKFGIPEDTFVFASFNNNYKIDHKIFTVWMTILKRTPNSILYILKNSEEAERNLILEAEKRDVSAERLIFTTSLPKEEHLARIRDLADLVLDTSVVNGHTTTTDCLWAGVPIVTVLGRHFASRVSASMLKAVGLPELVTKNLKEYEQLAVQLATDSVKLHQLKAKLKRNLATKPLFKTALYTKNLETIYQKIWADYRKTNYNKQEVL